MKEAQEGRVDVGADDVAPPTEAVVEQVVEAKVSAEDRRMCVADFRDEDIEESLDACTRIIELRGVGAGDKSFALSHRCHKFALAEDFRDAEKDCTAALELAPTDALKSLALEMRGKERNSAGRKTEGAADLARAKQLHGGTLVSAKGDWTICLANTTAFDNELVYTLSLPMDVQNVPGYLSRLQSERPDRGALDAITIQPKQLDKFFGICTPVRPTAEQAQAEATNLVSKFLEENRNKFPKIRGERGAWHIRGARME